MDRQCEALPETELVFPVLPMNLARMSRPQLQAQLAAVLVPGVLWLWLFFHLHVEWTLNTQYNYGWAVPFLGLLLSIFVGNGDLAARRQLREGRLCAGRMWLLLLCFSQSVCRRSESGLGLLSWLLACTVVGFSFALGVPRRWNALGLTHFAFPICFPLVASLAGPVREPRCSNMMRGVASVAVEITGWLGGERINSERHPVAERVCRRR